MPYFGILAGIAAGFFVLQAVLSGKVKNFAVKSLPAGLLICCLLSCLVIYVGISDGVSASVIAENQSFAKFFAIHILAALAGCMAGAAFVRVKKLGNRS